MNFLKIPDDLHCLCSLTSKPASLPRGGKWISYLWSRLSCFLLMSLCCSPSSLFPRVTWVKAMGSCAASTSNCSSPKWSFTSKWVGLAYKTQRQSPSSLIIFVSESPFSASLSLRGREEGGGGFIENSGFYINGLSRICNVAFLWDSWAERCRDRKGGAIAGRCG